MAFSIMWRSLFFSRAEKNTDILSNTTYLTETRTRSPFTAINIAVFHDRRGGDGAKCKSVRRIFKHNYVLLYNYKKIAVSVKTCPFTALTLYFEE